ncbi:hypothetical protein BCR44DRAFT_42484 [Catenaria anguillulae PL171]|uniref:Uncharacterized protein n=1 Tax=Catenaria anguillulae PL171 TaxID=765915 RepID=A0A1Y2HVF0_9FUNG|nr:hypothetical protein BCR44DRAFT_42484 [Catenaria anguillulae PL171]
MMGRSESHTLLASPLALALPHHHGRVDGQSDHTNGLDKGCSATCGRQGIGQQPQVLVILPPAFKNTSLDRILEIARSTYRNPSLDISDLHLKFAWATPDSDADTPPPQAVGPATTVPSATATASDSAADPEFGPAAVAMFRVRITHLQPTLTRADILQLVVQSVRRGEVAGVSIVPPVPTADVDTAAASVAWRSATFAFTNFNAAKSCYHWLKKVQAGDLMSKAVVPGAVVAKVVTFWSPNIDIVSDDETGSVRSVSVGGGARDFRPSSGSDVDRGDSQRSSPPPPVIPAQQVFVSRSSTALATANGPTPSWATALSLPADCADPDPQSPWSNNQPTWASGTPDSANAWPAETPSPAWASQPSQHQTTHWPLPDTDSDTTHPVVLASPRATPPRPSSPPPKPHALWSVTISKIDPRAKANSVLSPILDPVRGDLDPVQIRQLGVNDTHGRSVMFVFDDEHTARRFFAYMCAGKQARGFDGFAVAKGEILVDRVKREDGE